MFGLNPYSIAAKAAVILACLLGGFWAGHKVTSNAWRADQAAQETALRERYAEDTKAANARADEAERKVEAIRAGTRVVTRFVDRIVTRPVYAGACFDDDGVRAANAALTGAAPDPGEPHATVPGSGAAGLRNGSGGAAKAR